MNALNVLTKGFISGGGIELTTRGMIATSAAEAVVVRVLSSGVHHVDERLKELFRVIDEVEVIMLLHGGAEQLIPLANGLRRIWLDENISEAWEEIQKISDELKVWGLHWSDPMLFDCGDRLDRLVAGINSSTK